jgi:hypothetical protein
MENAGTNQKFVLLYRIFIEIGREREKLERKN